MSSMAAVAVVVDAVSVRAVVNVYHVTTTLSLPPLSAHLPHDDGGRLGVTDADGEAAVQQPVVHDALQQRQESMMGQHQHRHRS